MMSDPKIDWRRAKCRNEDKDLFFADDDPAADEKAVAVCNTCPIMHECRQWALTKPEKFGVWGGLTEDERRSLLARRKRVHCPGCNGRDVVADLILDRVEICRTCGLSWKI